MSLTKRGKCWEMFESCSMQHHPSAMYRLCVCTKQSLAQFWGNPVMLHAESPQREQEWVPWVVEGSVHAPLMLKIMQIAVPDLLTRHLFFQLVMIGWSGQFEVE